MTENFPNLMKDMNLHIVELSEPLTKINSKKTTTI